MSMGLLLRLLLALAASLALPAWASSLPAPSSSWAPKTASGVSAASGNEEHTYFVGELGAWVHNCTISTVAPDWGQKGAHIKVNGVEIAVRPEGGGQLALRPVFSSTDPAAFRAASAIASEALESATFRGQLHAAAGRAIRHKEPVSIVLVRGNSDTTAYA